MAMDDPRRVLDYSDLWVETSTIASAPPSNGVHGSPNNHKAKKQKVTAFSSSDSHNWSADGTPQTASSNRKIRRILTLLEAGNVPQAEGELSKLGSGKNNYEIQRALAMAKAGKSISHGNGNKHMSYDDENEDEGAEDWDEYDEEEDFDGEDDTVNATGKQLTHEEIWDDSALIDAWNAAEEEYKIFHSKRSAHEASRLQGGEDKTINDGEMGKKRSALWYDSPAKGSPAAIAAKAASQQEEERVKVELEERKRQARALLEQIAGPKSSSKNAETEPIKMSRKLKGTTPPSSSITGNLAWRSACATVSRTPNEIGIQLPAQAAVNGVYEKKHKAMPEEGHIPNGIDIPSTSRQAQGEEVFQNLAMAWYYAGYYQAMATKWNAEQNGA